MAKRIKVTRVEEINRISRKADLVYQLTKAIEEVNDLASRGRDEAPRLKSVSKILRNAINELKGRKSAAVELGEKGGKARAKVLTAAQRKAIAAAGAKARWADKKGEN